MRQLALLLFISAIVTSIADASAADAQFAGGKGTEEEPYQIETVEQLQAIADSANLDKHFLQVADINASGDFELE